MISLKDGDRVIGAVQLASDAQDLVFITSHAQLLRFGAWSVRPQGRAAGGMAGIRLSPRASVIWFGAAGPASPAGEVVTVASRSGALPGTMAATVTESACAEFPPKGRATGSSTARARWCWPGPVPARRGGPVDAGDPGGAAPAHRPARRLRRADHPAPAGHQRLGPARVTGRPSSGRRRARPGPQIGAGLAGVTRMLADTAALPRLTSAVTMAARATRNSGPISALGMEPAVGPGSAR